MLTLQILSFTKNHHLALACSFLSFFVCAFKNSFVTPLPNFARAKLKRKKMMFAILCNSSINLTGDLGKWKHYQFFFHLNFLLQFAHAIVDLTLGPTMVLRSMTPHFCWESKDLILGQGMCGLKEGGESQT